MPSQQLPGADFPSSIAPRFSNASWTTRNWRPEIVSAFLADTPGQVAALVDAFSRGDLPATGRLAHRVKGAAANLSAVRLQGLASEIETLARAGQRDQAGVLVARIAAECSAAESAMRLSLDKP